jgi:putative phosphoesterase
MSKALILSDIHSNIYALEAIWAEESDSDLIYCTGDLVDYGPFPAEVVAWMQAHEVICTQGNHDRAVVHAYREEPPLADLPMAERAWRHHNAARLNPEAIAYLAQLPQALSFKLDGLRYGLTHLYREYEEIVSLDQFEEFAASTYGVPLARRLIFGHTHRQAVRYLSDSHLWLNPGSVSYRRADDPDQTTHYAVIVDGEISLRRLAYNLAPLQEAVQQVTLQESELKVARRFFW